MRPTAQNAEAILNFWFAEATPTQWFRRDDAFDQAIKKRFSALHTAASNGNLDVWRTHPRYSLALILLLDQFSRNLFRDDAVAFKQDAQALDITRETIARRHDKVAASSARSFYYMPFMHSERLEMQDRCLALFVTQMPASMNVPFAIEHRNIIARFGRFPHRNHVLGRKSTPAEIAFLNAGGFNP